VQHDDSNMAISIEVTMALILGCIGLSIGLFSQLLQKKHELSSGSWLPSLDNPAKREFEIYSLGVFMFMFIYICIWVLIDI